MKIAPMIRVIDCRTFVGLQLMSSVSFGWGAARCCGPSGLAAVDHRVDQQARRHIQREAPDSNAPAMVPAPAVTISSMGSWSRGDHQFDGVLVTR
jgi:hypothetical protein